MANTITNFIPVLYEAIDQVSRELTGLIGGSSKDMSGEGIGLNQTVRVPVATSRTASTITPGQLPPNSGDETPDYEDIVLDKARTVPIRWGGEEQLAFTNTRTSRQTERFLTQQVAQAMRTLVNEVEADLAAEYIYASRAYGTAGTTPFASTLADVSNLKKILDDNGAPQMGRQLVINSTAGVNLRNLTQLVSADASGSTDLLRRGVLLPLMGFDVRESAGILSHTKGAGTGYLINNVAGEVVGQTALTLDGGTVNLTGIKAGDIVTFAVDSTNKYVVRTGLTATTGDITINKPGVRITLPDDNAMTIGNSYTANLAFVQDALKLVTRVPARPIGGDSADDVITVTDPVSGLTFSFAAYREYQQVVYCLELVWGVRLWKPEWAAILLG